MVKATVVPITVSPTTESRRRAKLARSRRANPGKSTAGRLLDEITQSVKILDEVTDNSRDPGFTYGVMVSALADAMAHVCPTTPAEALAQACLLWADIDNLEVNEHRPYDLKALFHRIKLRTFWLSTWIENEHGVRRENHGLDYFHNDMIAYRSLFPHESDEEVQKQVDESLREAETLH